MISNCPKISVVMAVFNGERFIGEAVESILNQTFTDFELIIIDNASVDRTKKIISSYNNDSRIVLVENKDNLGQTKALNIGIRLSRGDFIARMDADDVSHVERLELQYKYLIKHNSVAVLGTWHEEIDEAGRHIKYFKMPSHPLEIKCNLISQGKLGYYCVSHPTVMMRKEILLKVGAYNDNYRTQDYDLWMRIIRNYGIANLNRFLVKHRILKTQQSKEYRAEVESECEKIILSNIKYYLATLDDTELIPLVRMLRFKPQSSKEAGLRILKIFSLFFKKYLDDDGNNTLVNNIRDRMMLLYLLQLIKANPIYSIIEVIKLLRRNWEVLFDPMLYRKIAKSIYNKII